MSNLKERKSLKTKRASSTGGRKAHSLPRYHLDSSGVLKFYFNTAKVKLSHSETLSRLANTSLRANGRSRAGLLSNDFFGKTSERHSGLGYWGSFQPMTSVSISVPNTYSSRNWL